MIYAIKMEGHANTKIMFRGYEISIAMDDSCGVLKEYARSEIVVFHNDKDVTAQFFNGFACTADDLFTIMQNIAKL